VVGKQVSVGNVFVAIENGVDMSDIHVEKRKGLCIVYVCGP
jgi:hypothetical protein